MRKSILLLSGVGIGAGLLYALSSNREERNQDEGKSDKTGPAKIASGNERNVQGAGAKLLRTDENILTDRNDQRVGSSMKQQGEDSADAKNERRIEIDDRGTDQQAASQILKNVRDGAFDASDEKLAVALGRPTEEIENWTSGAGTIDGDVVMKARALAIERGVEIQ